MSVVITLFHSSLYLNQHQLTNLPARCWAIRIVMELEMLSSLAGHLAWYIILSSAVRIRLKNRLSNTLGWRPCRDPCVIRPTRRGTWQISAPMRKGYGNGRMGMAGCGCSAAAMEHAGDRKSDSANHSNHGERQKSLNSMDLLNRNNVGFLNSK